MISGGPLEGRSYTHWLTGETPEQEGVITYEWEAPRGQSVSPGSPCFISSHVWRPGLLKAPDREYGPKNRPPPLLGLGELEFKKVGGPFPTEAAGRSEPENGGSQNPTY